MSGNGTLHFPPFIGQYFRKDIHEAVYRCKATNPIGTIISRDVYVHSGKIWRRMQWDNFFSFFFFLNIHINKQIILVVNSISYLYVTCAQLSGNHTAFEWKAKKLWMGMWHFCDVSFRKRYENSWRLHPGIVAKRFWCRNRLILVRVFS